MIDPGDVDAYMAAHGPWLYHATDPDSVATVLEQGLRPGSELGRHNARGFHRTRPGHVYISTLADCHRLQDKRELGKGTIRIEVGELDPRLIDPDENLVQLFYWGWGFEKDEWVGVAPPVKDPGWVEGPNGEGTLWHWAETTPGFDAPEVTAKSLLNGQVSHRGTVPAHALEAFEG